MTVERVQIREATLYRGDALEVLHTLPAGSVDALICDPPYSSGGMFRGDRLQDVHTKYVAGDSDSGNALPSFSGDSRDQLGYWFWVALWLAETRRILAPGAIAGLFTDWRQLPVTSAALQSGGLIWRGIFNWHKPGARPVQGRWTNACEYLTWGTNGPRPLEGSPLPGFLTCNAPPGADRDHITQKPVTLMQELVKVVRPGAVVADWFMGSGTTGVAAVTMGRKFIGVELDAMHFDTSCRRIEEAYQQRRLFEEKPEPVQGALGLPAEVVNEEA